MNLQDTILKRYQTIYPDDSLRAISTKTGIQLTRVFRLMNGSEMKLREYEAFSNALSEGDTQVENGSFLNLARKCLSNISENKLKQFEYQMKYALRLHGQTKNSEQLAFNEVGA